MIDQVNYITQEKSKSEDQLVGCVALIRKNVKDYNELLKFSAEIEYAFDVMHRKLKAASTEQQSNSRFPVKEKEATSYKAIEKMSIKLMRQELKNLINNDQDNEISFPLVSSPSKGYKSTKQERNDRLSIHKESPGKKQQNRSLDRSMSRESNGSAVDSRPAASSRLTNKTVSKFK